jgi:3-methyladenine DNA glycosylase AlkD
MSTLKDILNDFQCLKNPEKAQILSRFFKTGKGQYGEGDTFLGIKVPEQRKLAKKHCGLSIKDIKTLLESGIHEQRLTALLILIIKYKKADSSEKQKIFDFYLKNTKFINNWDLVDLSAPNIVGHFLYEKDKSILIDLSKSSDLWKKRIAMISTYFFIKNNQFNTTLEVAENLLNDKHDLIHKAVGWMLRETGKRSLLTEEKFLKKHYKNMPRTTLRYAIEKFPEDKRKFYLAKD